MKPLQGAGLACALWFLGTVPAHAAWCNVFQVCCNSCGHAPAVAAYGPAADPCNPCPPQPVCTTRYVQRCYYQPVTCYQTKTYYEPVTTYRTSYYYEPVTSYRYSYYCDPCSGCCQQVACPTTCYQLRSQCCPVQSWVERCCQVPVTSYRLSSYWEPVTSCCTPPAAPCVPTGYTAPSPAPPAGVVPTYPPPPAAAAGPAYGTQPPPGVAEQPGAPTAPGVQEYPGNRSGSPLLDRTGPQYPTMPPASGLSRQAPPRLPVVTPPAVPVAPPSVKLERIVSLPGSKVQGQVVSRGNQPQPAAKLLFVSAEPGGPQRPVTADAAGQFQVTLASGGWLVYVNGPDGKPVFHSKIEVRGNQNTQVTLVSR